MWCVLECMRPQLLLLLLADRTVRRHNFQQRLFKMAERRLPGETEDAPQPHMFTSLAFFA